MAPFDISTGYIPRRDPPRSPTGEHTHYVQQIRISPLRVCVASWRLSPAPALQVGEPESRGVHGSGRPLRLILGRGRRRDRRRGGRRAAAHAAERGHSLNGSLRLFSCKPLIVCLLPLFDGHAASNMSRYVSPHPHLFPNNLGSGGLASSQPTRLSLTFLPYPASCQVGRNRFVATYLPSCPLLHRARSGGIASSRPTRRRAE